MWSRLRVQLDRYVLSVCNSIRIGKEVITLDSMKQTETKSKQMQAINYYIKHFICLG